MHAVHATSRKRGTRELSWKGLTGDCLKQKLQMHMSYFSTHRLQLLSFHDNKQKIRAVVFLNVQTDAITRNLVLGGGP